MFVFCGFFFGGGGLCLLLLLEWWFLFAQMFWVFLLLLLLLPPPPPPPPPSFFFFSLYFSFRVIVILEAKRSRYTEQDRTPSPPPPPTTHTHTSHTEGLGDPATRGSQSKVYRRQPYIHLHMHSYIPRDETIACEAVLITLPHGRQRSAPVRPISSTCDTADLLASVK